MGGLGRSHLGGFVQAGGATYGSMGGAAPVGATTMKIPSAMVGLVIGKGGENIRVMQTRSGANIQMQKDTEARPGATEREIYLTGEPGAVTMAQQCTLVCVFCRVCVRLAPPLSRFFFSLSFLFVCLCGISACKVGNACSRMCWDLCRVRHSQPLADCLSYLAVQ